MYIDQARRLTAHQLNPVSVRLAWRRGQRDLDVPESRSVVRLDWR